MSSYRRRPCRLRSVLSGALLLIPAASLQAMEAARELTEREYISDLPVVLSVSRLTQPLADAPAAVTVIDREMIRASGAREVWELMRLVPGFQVSPVVGSSPAVTYHGLTEQFPRRVQVLVDGRSQYSPFLAGGVNWNMMPVSLEDIERIEVIRGSNSAAYGSNAFMGVVNIITRTAADAPGVVVSGSRGGQGVSDSRLRWAGTVGPGEFRITAEESGDSGLDQQFDSRRTRRVDLRGDFRFGARDELQLQAGKLATGIGVGEGQAFTTDPERTQNYDSAYFQAIWRRSLSADEDFSLRYEFSREAGHDALMPTTLIFGLPVTVPLDYGYRAQRDSVELQHTLGVGDGLRVVSGAGYRGDQVVSRSFFGRDDPVALNVIRAFGNLEWRFHPQWLVNFGATWENHSLSGTSLSPRLGVNYQLTPGHTLRIAAARAYRSPSLIESRSNQVFRSLPIPGFFPGGIVVHGFVGRGAPRAEQLDSVELGYLGESRALGIKADVRVFSEKVHDRAFFAPFPLLPPNCDVPPPGLPAPYCGKGDAAANIQDATLSGLEYQLEWRPLERTRILLNQSFIRIRSGLYDVPDLINAPKRVEIVQQTDSSAPSRATSLMLIQGLPFGFDLGLTFHSIGAMRWTNATYTSAYHRLDWRLAYTFRFGPQRGELAFTSQSDSRAHGEHADTELVTPRKFLSLRLEF